METHCRRPNTPIVAVICLVLVAFAVCSLYVDVSISFGKKHVSVFASRPLNMTHPFGNTGAAEASIPANYGTGNGDAVPMQYAQVHNTTNQGIPFSVLLSTLKNNRLPPRNFVTLNNTSVRNFVFGTSASANHFIESLDALASIQLFWPNHTIVYVDLGLEDVQVEKLSRYCNVKHRKFDFDKFPPHVRYLKNYGWKALVIQMLLSEFDAVFYMDPSVRIMTSNLEVPFSMALNTDGCVMLTGTTYSTYAVTHPTMYNYFPTNMTAMKTLNNFQSGTLLLYNTASFYWNVMHWWLLCSLEEYCMAPVKNKKYCECPNGDSYTSFCDCHRYDQSALNILVDNHLEYDYDRYVVHPRYSKWMFLVQRFDTTKFRVRTC